MEGRPDCIITDPAGTTKETAANYDSITVIATKRFKSGPIKPIFQGKNYRKAWKTPIKVPVVSLAKLEGGIEPLEMGGGMQTLSMDLLGKDGTVYTLRSVNKDPDDVIPDVARKLNLENIIMDGMSAQHPYGAIWAAALSDQIGILHTNPRIVYLPSQVHLDTFNQLYGGRLFLLEYEPEGSGDWVQMDNVKGIVDTEEVERLLFNHPTARIDECALVKARLFDLLIGDWDRHAKQWGWVVTAEDNHLLFTPLPTDRDNAFYNPNGLILWTITRPWSQPLLRPFRNKIDYLPGMVKPFDQRFLLNVPESVFVEMAHELQRDLTDEKIEKALQSLPAQFVKLDAKKIQKRIQARRADLVQYAKAFKQIVDERGPLTEPLKGSSRVYIQSVVSRQ